MANKMTVNVRNGGSRKVKKPPVDTAKVKKLRTDPPAKKPVESDETEEGGNK